MEIVDWESEIELLLRVSSSETQCYDFKQGFHKLCDVQDAEADFRNNVYDFVKVLSSCANNNLGNEGYVIVGIADGEGTRNRINQLYGVDSYSDSSWNNNFYITGLQGEIQKYYKGKIDTLKRRINECVCTLPIDDYAKQYIISHSSDFSFKGKTLFVFCLKAEKGKRVKFDGKFYQRVGEETKEIPNEPLVYEQFFSQLNNSNNYHIDELKDKYIDLQAQLIKADSYKDEFYELKRQNELLKDEIKRQKALLEEEGSKLTEQDKRAYELGYLTGISHFKESQDELINAINSFTVLPKDPVYQRIIGTLFSERGMYEEAFEWINMSAHGKDPLSLTFVGQFYDYGIGVQQNHSIAVKKYEKAIEYGNLPISLFSLGCCYFYGNGVDVDLDKAIDLWMKASELGYAPAQTNLALCYLNGKGVARDVEMAISYFKKSSSQGEPMAQNALGSYYYDGQFVEQDYKIAYDYFFKSAMQGYPLAQYNLANCFLSGRGTDRDVIQALNFYNLSANNGVEDAQIRLAILYSQGKVVEQNIELSKYWLDKCSGTENLIQMGMLSSAYYDVKDYDNAFKYSSKSSEMGSLVGLGILGKCYYYGNGVEQSYEKAVECFEETLSLGGGLGWPEFLLGICYYCGYGVTNDLKKAFDYFMQSVSLNVEEAYFNLAMCYYCGYGTEVNTESALFYFEKANSVGDSRASFYLGIYYVNGFVVEKDEEKAFAFFKQSAESGSMCGQDWLAFCYRDGIGTIKDFDTAIYWYTKSANQGYSRAQVALGILLQRCNRYSESIYWYEKAFEQGNEYARYNLGLCYLVGKGVDVDLCKAKEFIEKALLDDEVKSTVIEEARNGNEEEMKALDFVGVEY